MFVGEMISSGGEIQLAGLGGNALLSKLVIRARLTMRDLNLPGLTVFAAIVEHGSFVAAARHLGLSTPSVSQALRGLEERLGVRLLNRTTRSVTLTEAGGALLAQVRPALDQLVGAVEAVNVFRDRPAGTLRLAANGLAADALVLPVASDFMAEYPDIKLDLTIIDGAIDVVAGGFDAGIGAGALIAKDMIAARLAPDSRWVALASPSYLKRHGAPHTPTDLRDHNCVRWRMTNGAIFPWRFMIDGQAVEFDAGGSLVTNSIPLLARAVVEGACIALGIEAAAKRRIDQGQLVPLLQEYAYPWAGWHIYYPSRHQLPLPLRAFIDFLRAHPAVAYPAKSARIASTPASGDLRSSVASS
jgi:DNA-binding transcriptional LysR family regulator